MARSSHLLLVTALIYLCTCLPPATPSPAFLKPEGSYSPEREEAIKHVDNLLNQFLEQLLIAAGKNITLHSDEDAPKDDEDPYSGETQAPLPPTPAPVTARPCAVGQEGGFHTETQPAMRPSYPGQIVFPSD